MNPPREMVDRHQPLRHPIGWVIDGASRTKSNRFDPVTAGQGETAHQGCPVIRAPSPRDTSPDRP